MKFTLDSLVPQPKASDVHRRVNVYVSLLELLVDINLQYLRLNPTPPLYELPIWYMDFPEWQDIPAMLRSGRGSTMDLVAWRVAELREKGSQGTFVRVSLLPGDEEKLRVQVDMDGVIEDPSEIVKGLTRKRRSLG
jgi:hypothetical protein